MKYLLIILITTLSYSNVLNNNEIDIDKPALQIVSVQDTNNLVKIKNQFLNDNLFIKKISNYYVVYLVNFENKMEMLKKKEELKSNFSDSIAMNKLSDRVYIQNPLQTKSKSKPQMQTQSQPKVTIFNQNKKEIKKTTKPIVEKQTKNSKFTRGDLIKYKRAIDFFQAKNYEKSYELFNELFINYLDNEKINFYLGRSAFELKKYNESYAAYQRILIQDEDNQRVRLEVGRILYLLKSYDNALKEFEIVLKHPIPAQVRQNVQALIETIKNKKQKYFFSGAYQVGLGWDDNVYNNTYEDFTTYGTGFLTNDTEKVVDSFNKEVLVLNYIRPFKNNKSLAYESSAIFYLQNFSKEHTENIGLVSLTNGVSYVKEKQKFVLNFLTDKVWYGSDPLLETYGISPKVTYLYNKSTIFEGYLKYTQKKMSQSSDKDLDANVKNITLSIIKKFDDKSNLQFKTYFTKEEKVRGIRSDVTKNARGFTLSYAKELVPTYNTLFSYQRDAVRYKENDPNLPSREDDLYTFGINVTKTINKASSISMNYSKTKVSGNIEVNTYNKNSLGLTYTKTF